jgi:Ca2+:H+ antiporter
MCFVIPSAFSIGWTKIGSTTAEAIITDEFRDVMLKISRGMAIIMLCVYVASRVYQVNPPGDDSDDVYAEAGGHEAFREEEEALKTEQPKLSPWFCFALLVVLVGLIAVTAEWLVDSIEEVRESARIEDEYACATTSFFLS